MLLATLGLSFPFLHTDVCAGLGGCVCVRGVSLYVYTFCVVMTRLKYRRECEIHDDEYYYVRAEYNNTRRAMYCYNTIFISKTTLILTKRSHTHRYSYLDHLTIANAMREDPRAFSDRPRSPCRI